jgi:hypothetical protein
MVSEPYGSHSSADGQVHLGALRRAEGVELAGIVEPLGPVRSQLVAVGCPLYGER